MAAVTLQLTKGKTTLIDEEDSDRVKEHKWLAVETRNGFYAATHPWVDGKTVRLYLHRFLADAPKGMEVDHINGDTLDNRRENLRVCSHAENLRNQRQQRGTRSGYKCVYWESRRQKWMVQMKIKGKNTYLGLFENKLDAAKRYNEVAMKLYGEYARPNIQEATWQQ